MAGIRSTAARFEHSVIQWLPEWVWSMFKFGLKGGIAVLINAGLLTILVELGGVAAELAVIVLWVITLVPGYLATDKLVFSTYSSPEDVKSHGKRGTLHYGVMWSGKALNYGIYLVLLQFTPIYQAAWIIGAVAVFPYTFGLNYWFWKTEPDGIREAVFSFKSIRFLFHK